MCSSADVYVVCFDAASPASLERVRDQWLPEIRGYNSTAPFVLVATKCDERIKAQVRSFMLLMPTPKITSKKFDIVDAYPPKKTTTANGQTTVEKCCVQHPSEVLSAINKVTDYLL